MKYTLICHTFNRIEGGKLVLRNNWMEQVSNDEVLKEKLMALGFKSETVDRVKTSIENNVIKLMGDFTLDNTSIISYITKNQCI